MSVVDSFDTILPPESFQRRNNIIKVSLDLTVTLFTHFDREGDTVEQSDRLLVLSILSVRIAMPANCNIVHAWHRYDRRLSTWHVEFLILFPVIKRHVLFPPLP